MNGHITVHHPTHVGWPRNQHVNDYIVYEGELHQVTGLTGEGYNVKNVPLSDEVKKLLTPDHLEALKNKATYPAPWKPAHKETKAEAAEAKAEAQAEAKAEAKAEAAKK